MEEVLTGLKDAAFPSNSAIRTANKDEIDLS